MGNLHGTEVDKTNFKPLSSPLENDETSEIDANESKTESHKNKKSKKKMNRLKSFFSTANDTF